MMRAWPRRTAFVLVLVLLYAATYYAAERTLVYGAEHNDNRFYRVRTLPYPSYDYVVLGSSHALPFDFGGMNEELERRSESRIVNLASAGGGVVPNRLLMDYFLQKAGTRNVLYVVDSFAFYSSEWNEGRLNDSELYAQAPFDPTLLRLFTDYVVSGQMGPSAALDYLSGFSKINNPHDRASTIAALEGWFDRTYKPSDRERSRRIDRLYLDGTDTETRDRYLDMFVDWIRSLQERNVEVVVLKTPIPEVFYAVLPDEAEFDEVLAARLVDVGAAFYNFSQVNNDPSYFFDTDHLNRTGMEAFLANYLAEVLITHRLND